MGRNLSLWREVNRITREELACRLRISEELLTRIETGQEPFTMPFLVKLGLACAVNPAMFLAGAQAISATEVTSRYRDALLRLVEGVDLDSVVGE